MQLPQPGLAGSSPVSEDGLLGTTAELDQPFGVTVAGGKVIFTDCGNNRLRMTTG